MSMQGTIERIEQWQVKAAPLLSQFPDLASIKSIVVDLYPEFLAIFRTESGDAISSHLAETLEAEIPCPKTFNRANLLDTYYQHCGIQETGDMYEKAQFQGVTLRQFLNTEAIRQLLISTGAKRDEIIMTPTHSTWRKARTRFADRKEDLQSSASIGFNNLSTLQLNNAKENIDIGQTVSIKDTNEFAKLLGFDPIITGSTQSSSWMQTGFLSGMKQEHCDQKSKYQELSLEIQGYRWKTPSLSMMKLDRFSVQQWGFMNGWPRTNGLNMTKALYALHPKSFLDVQYQWKK